LCVYGTEDQTITIHHHPSTITIPSYTFHLLPVFFLFNHIFQYFLHQGSLMLLILLLFCLKMSCFVGFYFFGGGVGQRDLFLKESLASYRI
jgi:hypothetical protein